MRSNWGQGGRKSSSWAQGIAAVGAMLAASAGGSALAAPTETVLYTFQGGADGGVSFAGLIRDFYGNLYGTTFYGGQLTGCGGKGCGVVFKLPLNGKETALYTFTGGADGANSQTSLSSDCFGNLYGTTTAGGAVSAPACPPNVETQIPGCGVVFKLSPGGKETVLHAFAGSPSDGSYPLAGLTFDRFGNLWGTTTFDGLGAAPGNGVVFKISPDGTYTVPHFFAGSPSDGAGPDGNLLAHRHGHIYGMTINGGAVSLPACNGPPAGCGEVFKISQDGVKTTLYDFTGGADGANPFADLIADRWGNLYGTTLVGGAVSAPACADFGGCGVVFKLSPSGKETVLYTFQGGSDGGFPEGGLIADCKGNLYGTAFAGGAVSAPACAPRGCGVVYKLSPSGKETVLYAFQGGSDGAGSGAGLIADRSGNLYSTTPRGGAVSAPACAADNGCGVVFKITGTGFATGDEDECRRRRDDGGEGADNSE